LHESATSGITLQCRASYIPASRIRRALPSNELRVVLRAVHSIGPGIDGVIKEMQPAVFQRIRETAFVLSLFRTHAAPRCRRKNGSATTFALKSFTPPHRNLQKTREKYRFEKSK